MGTPSLTSRGSAYQPSSILVVDDEETMRQSLAEILKLEGYLVQTASDGDEAIAYLEKSVAIPGEEFDVLLLDLKMPGKDGIEVLRLATQISAETQVILLTAHGSLESAIEALRYGAHDYLLKPASPNQILASVEKAMARRVEAQHRRDLLEQLEVSINALRDTEPPRTRERSEQVFEFLKDGVQVDLTRRLIWKESLTVRLTPAEGRLLEVFLEKPGQLCSHQELVLRVQGYSASEHEAPSIIRPLVSRLRKKLSEFPGGKSWIISVRSAGYLLDLGSR